MFTPVTFIAISAQTKLMKTEMYVLFFEEQAARLKKMEELEKRKKAEFRKKVSVTTDIY